MSRAALFASSRCWGATSSLLRAAGTSAYLASPQCQSRLSVVSDGCPVHHCRRARSASKRVWLADGESDGGLLRRNTCGEPSRAPRRCQQVDYAWERPAAYRSRAPDGIRPAPQPIDLVGAGTSDDWLMAMGIVM